LDFGLVQAAAFEGVEEADLAKLPGRVGGLEAFDGDFQGL